MYIAYNQWLKQRYNERKRNGSKIDPFVLWEVDGTVKWSSDEDNV